ncbi:MAG: hypothetical protein Q8O76_02115 [Chloroflexota bacterium]|nr:hypothetical protein [Chloroflexota bacterium]
MRGALRAERPVHVLFTGVPSSAKTMFLLELARLGAPYILGSQATKAGIAEVLFDLEPQLLLVDEIDRIGTKDIAILLSLMQPGIVSETKAGRCREVRLQTRVFAASNTTKMPRELLSRFMVLFFKPYSREEFLEVTTHLLLRTEKVEPEIASYVAHKAWEVRGVPDPREAVRIGRLAKSRAAVDRVCEVLLKYSVS